MARALQRLPGNERLKPVIFGVRHLSPAGSYHLLKLLDEKRPKCVLIEGPADFTPFINDLANPGVRPPAAIMAYTADLPVKSLSLPIASYSPEYQAALWAKKNRAECRFIDLPANISFAVRDGSGDEIKKDSAAGGFLRFNGDLYKELALIEGYESFDSYWEANFEHNLNPGAYFYGVREHSAQMRLLAEEDEKENNPGAYKYNILRESYMKREMQRAVHDGFSPADTVVVCGAYHVLGLEGDTTAAADEELESLPRRETKITLMPYSYYKLSSRSGYGAGNCAPAYFERLWESLSEENPDGLPARYLSELAGALRRGGGTESSTASVIEAVRLSRALASLKDLPHPVLSDLHSAAVSCFGGGEFSNIAEAVARCDVGTAIGALPEGVSQTPLQDDFNRQMNILKLERYKSAVAQSLDLDLRENRRVQSGAAAFLDLRRSEFLHRLKFLNIPFAEPAITGQRGASWSEKWNLRWTPEAEIALIETNLKGDSIEVAAAYALKELLDKCTDVQEASRLIRAVCECRLPLTLNDALDALQTVAADSSGLNGVAEAAHELSRVIQYGDVRNFDSAPLVPLLSQLFLRACLLLQESAACDDKAADEIMQAISLLHIISQEHFEDIDDALWLHELKSLAFRDDRNPKLSGAAFAVLSERGEIPDDRYYAEVSRRLSPGAPVGLGAGWFEGISGRNRYALLSRHSLWRELDKYVAGLDDDEFTRCLVFLRRAFSSFDPNEKNSAAEILSGLWGYDERQTAELIQGELNEEEQESLDALADFDFGDF